MSSNRQIPYYYNRSTGQTQWEKPSDFKPANENMKENHAHAYHLLVKHVGSRRPSSWRESIISRSRQEALDMLQKYRDEIISTEKDVLEAFKELANRVSDCSSARNGGDLGEFGRGQMQRPFEDAAFSQNIGDVGPVVETDSGLHIIYVVSRR